MTWRREPTAEKRGTAGARCGPFDTASEKRCHVPGILPVPRSDLHRAGLLTSAHYSRERCTQPRCQGTIIGITNRPRTQSLTISTIRLSPTTCSNHPCLASMGDIRRVRISITNHEAMTGTPHRPLLALSLPSHPCAATEFFSYHPPGQRYCRRYYATRLSARSPLL